MANREPEVAAPFDSSEEVALLFDGTASLLRTRDPLAFIDELYRRLAGLLDVELYVHFAVSADATHLELAAAAGLSSQQRADLAHLDFNQAVCGTVAHRRQRMIVNHVQHSDDPLTEVIRLLGITAYVCHPLIVDERLFGTLSFGSRHHETFEPGAVALIRAVSNLVALALARARDEQSLRDADRRKDEFLATLAHELRNPLAPIQSGIDVLRLRAEDPFVQRVVPVMERQMGHLTQLVDDLLDTSRIARGKVVLRPEPLDLNALVQDLLAERAPPDQRHIEARLPPDPVAVKADPVRMRQVIGNLLDNAIKYTNDGGHVWISLDAEPDAVRVSVKDDGIGIDPQQLDDVFTAFRQVEPATAGLGLGLTLVRRLVELHGGRVEARSDGNHSGSEFVVQLPALLPSMDEEKSG